MSDLSPDEPLQIGRYRLLSRLGRGGMGTVYLGESPDGQQVAIKVINSEYSQHERFRMRFRREADSAQRVRRFCTAAVIEAALDGDQLYVVTEYVTGPNLEEAVESGGPLRGSSLDALAVGVATALTAIHAAGVVHRDLKPSNVLLSPVGPRVIDFGIARALDTLSGMTGTGEILGTPRYMAPEVLRGEPVSAACDVFSWGCLMAFAASGRAPFGGEALPAVLYQVLNTEPTLEGMEPTLHELVTYALAKDPRNRPTSQQLLDHLVGRSAAPEQAAHSVQTSWQGTPGTYESAPWAGPAGVPGGPSPDPGRDHPAISAQDGRTISGAPQAGPGHTAPGAFHYGPGHTLLEPQGDLGAASRERSARRRKLVIGAAAAALLVGGALGLSLLLSPSGPPENLALLYQDDFTQSGTGWSGGAYNPLTGTYGYAPDGYYAIDVSGYSPVKREQAPIPFVPAPPATPDPTASPTPVTPGRILLGTDITIRSGSIGMGEYGLFCRGEDDNKATRYEFLLDTAGNARIRKTVKSSGGELTKPVKVDLPKGKAARVEAECTGADGGVQLIMWVNGERTQSFLDPDPLPNGLVGVIVRVGENSDAVLRTAFDNFTLRGPAATGQP
ncbi:serine/threonine protein kinase [Streptosporangium sp. NBC_01755]|uniref:serine/threonine-protein kinase n=1 Tax=Streptosporangium sp. NBC_01755 TaxID=2975949 RepID=UPI002DDC70FF|nr:serine/threonine-protein kinase [Streptosporangium sp. NBC_01755]WSD01619.1 serine/threonine protein kinase [Streptosporangium sp. NBC_01755]